MDDALESKSIDSGKWQASIVAHLYGSSLKMNGSAQASAYSPGLPLSDSSGPSGAVTASNSL